jgi:hypothetical protein
MQMKRNKIIGYLLLAVVGISFSCRDESLYPLPYGNQDVSGILGLYRLSSGVFDSNDIAGGGTNTALEGVFEAMDPSNGNDVQSVEFYVSHRRVAGLTGEVLVKTVAGTDFQPVPQPTISQYKRSTIRVTYAETLTALNSIAADPDGGGPLVGFPGSVLAGDNLIYRWVLVMKDGRRFSVANPQNNNPLENNVTVNISTQPFYSAPYLLTIPVRPLLAGSWVGTYNLTQSAIWSPAHGWDFHANYPARLRSVLFPDQVVTLATVPGGLSTERQFQVQYRGQTVTMRINLEAPATGTAGTVVIPIQSTTLDCSGTRKFFWGMPLTGNFTRPGTTTVNLTAPLPTATTPNRGSFNTTQTGLVAGQIMTIGLDDDADEYGLRNGYCDWTRRVRLTLTKN